jgi:hypothetical protein
MPHALAISLRPVLLLTIHCTKSIKHRPLCRSCAVCGTGGGDRPERLAAASQPAGKAARPPVKVFFKENSPAADHKLEASILARHVEPDSDAKLARPMNCSRRYSGAIRMKVSVFVEQGGGEEEDARDVRPGLAWAVAAPILGHPSQSWPACLRRSGLMKMLIDVRQGSGSVSRRSNR